MTFHVPSLNPANNYLKQNIVAFIQGFIIIEQEGNYKLNNFSQEEHMIINQKERSEIAPAYKWRLEALFETDELWLEEYEAALPEIDKLSQYKGTLAQSAEQLYACMKAQDEISMRVERIYVYANMKSHEDSSLPKYQGFVDKADTLIVRLMTAASFFNPELLSMDSRLIDSYMKENEELRQYRHAIDDLMRQKEHVLSEEIEGILAQAAEIGQGPENIFSMLNNADMSFGPVTDEEGVQRELTHGNYISLMESKSRAVREEAFKTYYKAYWAQKNTLSAIYSASVKKDVFFARQRKYPSALEASLSQYNIPKSVYTNLIDTVKKGLGSMHRYVKLRKEKLGLKELHMYDLYVPMVPEADTSIAYEDAKETVLRALSVLGEDYVSMVRESFENSWIDVYENRGKRSGAYSWGAYGCHPYILLNFDNKINDMFTLAHEMGHAMHSHYSWTTQPYTYGDYTIFVAEVASTVNEALLLEYLLKTTTDKAMRDYLLNYQMEQFRGTLFRQCMFAEFELRTHDMAEQGEPLTHESLRELYRELNIAYYGNGIALDEEIGLEWARIPHFYTPFYVYQYATGYSAAVALSKKILDEGEPAVKAYKEFLKSGSKDYSIELLKRAGVDLSSPEPVEQALGVFDRLVHEMVILK